MTQPADLMRAAVLATPAYQVVDASGMIKLDAMENPYRWPASDLQAAWLEHLSKAALNRYPDPTARELLPLLRRTQGIPDTAGCLLGNGSDELIQMLILAIQGSGRPVMAPTPSFVMYEVLARACGVPFVGVPLAADLGLDVPAMQAALAEHQPALVFLAYPNNPTGVLYPAEQITAVLAANPGITVIDEAYAPFSSHSFLPQVGHPPGLMVMRTFSKLGLAGLRLGYLAATPAWIDALDRLRLPYNINTLTQLSAAFALQHQARLQQQADQLCEQRSLLQAALHALPGVRQVIPSQANFILFQVRAGQGTATYQALRDAGILIKNMSHPNGGPLQDYLRVTVGTPEENQAFLRALANHAGV